MVQFVFQIQLTVTMLLIWPVALLIVSVLTRQNVVNVGKCVRLHFVNLEINLIQRLETSPSPFLC